MRRHKIPCTCDRSAKMSLVGVFMQFFVYWCSRCATQRNVLAGETKTTWVVGTI